MNSVKRDKILKSLDTEIEKIRNSAKKTDEASKQTLTGWSAAGDKYHAMGAADLTKNYLKRLELLRNELENAPKGSSNSVEPPCFIKVGYDDSGVADLVLVINAISLPNVSFISTKSPLGKAVLGKEKGDNFQYELGDGKKYSGSILLLE